MTDRFKLALFAATAFGAAASVNPASAATVWTSWTSFTTGSSAGSAAGTMGGVGVTYSGELQNLFSNYPSYNPATSWVGGIVQNIPSPNQIIQVYGGNGRVTDTISFSTPVTNPILAIWSLGQAGDTAEFDFAQTPTFDAGGPSAEYGGQAITISGNTVYGTEGDGSIDFAGTFSSISFTLPVFENWYGFTVGMNAASVPEPASLALLGAGLLGLVASRRRA